MRFDAVSSWTPSKNTPRFKSSRKGRLLEPPFPSWFSQSYQVNALLIVYFDVGALDQDFCVGSDASHLVELVEEVFDASRLQSPVLVEAIQLIRVLAEHRVSFSRASLSVSKYGAIVPSDTGIDHLSSDVVENVLLRSLGSPGPVEGEVFGFGRAFEDYEPGVLFSDPDASFGSIGDFSRVEGSDSDHYLDVIGHRQEAN